MKVSEKTVDVEKLAGVDIKDQTSEELAVDSIKRFLAE